MIGRLLILAFEILLPMFSYLFFLENFNLQFDESSLLSDKTLIDFGIGEDRIQNILFKLASEHALKCVFKGSFFFFFW